MVIIEPVGDGGDPGRTRAEEKRELNGELGGCLGLTGGAGVSRLFMETESDKNFVAERMRFDQ